MAIYEIETTEHVSVLYEIEAKSKKAAEEYIAGNVNGSHGHEISWERAGLCCVDSVKKIDKFSDDYIIGV